MIAPVARGRGIDRAGLLSEDRRRRVKRPLAKCRTAGRSASRPERQLVGIRLALRDGDVTQIVADGRLLFLTVRAGEHEGVLLFVQIDVGVAAEIDRIGTGGESPLMRILV